MLFRFFIMHLSEEILLENLNETYNATVGLIETFKWNSSFSSENTTPGRFSEFKPIMDIMLLIAIILIMIAMGFEMKKEELLYHVKKPIGVGIGMLSQFVILPLAAFFLLQCISVSGMHATGVLIMSCCPGGPISNMLAYYCDGDLTLSVTMTSFSNLLAMGVMPLNLWIYGRSFETHGLVIPYVKLAISLVSITSPVVLGMVLRWKISGSTKVIIKVGSIISLLFIVIYTVFELVTFPEMFTKVPGNLYGITLILPLIGFASGYTLALVFRQKAAIRKTVAAECGVQNISTALAVIFLSFPLEYQMDLIAIPYLYSFTVITSSSVGICIYKVYKWRTTSKERSVIKEIETGVTENALEDTGAKERMLQPNNTKCVTTPDAPDTHIRLL